MPEWLHFFVQTEIEYYRENFFWVVFAGVVVYFWFWRGRILRTLLPEQKMTKRERKEKDRQFYQRTKKEHLVVFWNKLILKGYPEERKTKFFIRLLRSMRFI